MSDPQSAGYHVYLQGNPDALTGRTIVAKGLKRVDYSPDWCRGPADVNNHDLVDVDEENEVYVRKDSAVVLGTVHGFDGNKYQVDHEDMETGEITTFEVSATQAVHQIRKDRWWVE